MKNLEQTSKENSTRRIAAYAGATMLGAVLIFAAASHEVQPEEQIASIMLGESALELDRTNLPVTAAGSVALAGGVLGAADAFYSRRQDNPQ